MDKNFLSKMYYCIIIIVFFMQFSWDRFILLFKFTGVKGT